MKGPKSVMEILVPNGNVLDGMSEKYALRCVLADSLATGAQSSCYAGGSLASSSSAVSKYGAKAAVGSRFASRPSEADTEANDEKDDWEDEELGKEEGQLDLEEIRMRWLKFVRSQCLMPFTMDQPVKIARVGVRGEDSWLGSVSTVQWAIKTVETLPSEWSVVSDWVGVPLRGAKVFPLGVLRGGVSF